MRGESLRKDREGRQGNSSAFASRVFESCACALEMHAMLNFASQVRCLAFLLLNSNGVVWMQNGLIRFNRNSK